MKCEEVVQHIIAQAGRTAPAGEVERHLWACQACSQVYLEQQALWRQMDAWEAPEVSAGFDRRLFTRIGQRAGFGLDWMTRLFRPLQPALPAAVACMLLLAAVVVQKDRHLANVTEPTVAAQTAEELRQIDVALDDIQMLSEFEILPVDGAGEGKS